MPFQLDGLELNIWIYNLFLPNLRIYTRFRGIYIIYKINLFLRLFLNIFTAYQLPLFSGVFLIYYIITFSWFFSKEIIMYFWPIVREQFKIQDQQIIPFIIIFKKYILPFSWLFYQKKYKSYINDNVDIGLVKHINHQILYLFWTWAIHVPN